MAFRQFGSALHIYPLVRIHVPLFVCVEKLKCVCSRLPKRMFPDLKFRK